MKLRRAGIVASHLALALALRGLDARAQYTGGRIGGSNWGAPQPAPAPPPPVIAVPPPPPVIAAPPPAPAPPPVIAAPDPVAPVAVPPPPAPPAARIPVHRWQRGTPWPGDVVGASEDRVVDDAERRAASPSWSGGWRSGPMKHVPGAVAGGLTFTLLFGLTVLLTKPRRGGAAPRVAPQPVGPSMPAPRPVSVRPAVHPGVELRQLSVAFDASARPWIQQQLGALAARVDPSTPPGLHAVATGARDILGSAHRAARYAMFQSFSRDSAGAQPLFAQLADRARGRYTVETVTNARRIAGPTVHAKPEEGGGLVVVTVLVAVNGPLENLPATLDLPSVMNALQGMVPPRADRLLALEVVWSPASEGDRMSSAELVVLYPELLPLAGTAPMGRHVCASCRAVYALELQRCPACGAG